MEKFNLKNDISVVCVTARSFPDGIQEAFDELERKTGKKEKTLYGLSQPGKNGEIVYKAAMATEEEAEKCGLETLMIPKGEYLTETILGWKDKLAKIPDVFRTLLSNYDIDRKSFCVEWYKSDQELVCMVKTNT